MHVFLSSLSLLPRFRAELLDLQSLYCISKKSNPWTRRVDFQKIESDAKKDKLWKTPRNIEKSPKSSYFFEMEGKKIGPHFFFVHAHRKQSFFSVEITIFKQFYFWKKKLFWKSQISTIMTQKNLYHFEQKKTSLIHNNPKY